MVVLREKIVRFVAIAALYLLVTSLGLPGFARAKETPCEKLGEKSGEKSGLENRLAKSSSAYLRSARCQPVDWHPFGEEPFALAKAQDKPILLDIGAVWCHWCHVMDRESYENPEIAKLINRLFIAVKVDRDARPDIDQRYQRLVQAMTGNGGWPLTVFLTPSGEVFFGGTYFPPEDRGGRRGLKTLLPRIALIYKQRREEITATARRTHESVQRFLEDMTRTGDLHSDVVERVWRAMERRFDRTHGGFGNGPKFPLSSAIDFALYRAHEAANRAAVSVDEHPALNLARVTLDGMANGALTDQLGGGLHRYTMDGAWGVPHYEKMSGINAALLRTYVQAYQATGKKLYEETARGIARYVLETLADHARGGFAATQDADINMDDDGSYYTWTRGELHDALTPMERGVAGLHFGLDLSEPFRGDRKRQPLKVAMRAAAIARRLAKPQSEVAGTLRSAKAKLLALRKQRPTPFVDRARYVQWNSMLITALIETGTVLNEPSYVDFALRSLDVILRQSYRHGEGFSRIVGKAPGAEPALLVDQVYALTALLAAYQLTAERRFLRIAEATFTFIWDHLRDREYGGFFDRQGSSRMGAQPRAQSDAKAFAVLDSPLKLVRDGPTAAANSVAAHVFIDLWMLTYNDRYRQAAEETLRAFAGSAELLGQVTMASYALAVSRFLQPPTQAVIIGEEHDSLTRELHRVALQTYRPGKLVRRHAPSEANLPYPASKDGTAIAYVCTKMTCAPPTSDPSTLQTLLNTFPSFADAPTEESFTGSGAKP